MAQSQLLLVEGAEQLDGDADLGDGMSMSLLSASLPGAFQVHLQALYTGVGSAPA